MEEGLLNALRDIKSLGLGAKFRAWRPHQAQAVADIVQADTQFIVSMQPTGNGKSPCYIAAAKILRGRALVLTSFKGLQEQLHRDFGLFVLMGRSSYRCRRDPKRTCEEGICRIKKFCAYQEDGTCAYLQAFKQAQHERIVVTNYAFWLANVRRRNELGFFDFLVCDEAHIIHQFALDFMSMRVYPRDVQGICGWPAPGEEFSTYRDWLRSFYSTIQSRYERVSGLRFDKDKSQIVRLYHRFANVPSITQDNWVIEHKGNQIQADMVQPTALIQKRVFGNIRRVLLTSATIDKRICAQMGLNEENSVFKEYPSTFEPDRRPVYAVKCVRMDSRAKEEDYRRWMQMIDAIIGARLGTKGIIHAVSYARCKYILEHSAYSFLMMSHGSKDTARVVEEFKRTDQKTVLVSPSVVTGWDFPYDECRWQIIAKVPFPDLRSAVDKARQKLDPEYGKLLAYQTLLQACGRGMRYADDYCETFIIDDHFRWFFGDIKAYAPKYWKDAVRFVYALPDVDVNTNINT